MRISAHLPIMLTSKHNYSLTRPSPTGHLTPIIAGSLINNRRFQTGDRRAVNFGKSIRAALIASRLSATSFLSCEKRQE